MSVFFSPSLKGLGISSRTQGCHPLQALNNRGEPNPDGTKTVANLLHYHGAVTSDSYIMLVFFGAVTLVTNGHMLIPLQLLSGSTCNTPVHSVLTLFLAQGHVAVGVEVEFKASLLSTPTPRALTLVTHSSAFCPTLFPVFEISQSMTFKPFLLILWSPGLGPGQWFSNSVETSHIMKG